MTGADLKCECGFGAADVSPEFEIGEFMSVSWSCHDGHQNITGYNLLTGQVEQMQFDEFSGATSG